MSPIEKLASIHAERDNDPQRFADQIRADKAKARAKRARENRKAKDQIMRDCGLVKVRGALGGTYWE